MYGKTSEMHCHHIKFKLSLNACILKYTCTVNVCEANITTHWDMTLCNLVEIYQHVRGIWCPHLQNTVSNRRRVCLSHLLEPWISSTGQCFVETVIGGSHSAAWLDCDIMCSGVCVYQCSAGTCRCLHVPKHGGRRFLQNTDTSSKPQHHFNIVIKCIIHTPCNLSQCVSIFKSMQ